MIEDTIFTLITKQMAHPNYIKAIRQVYHSMKERCNNPNSTIAKWYGARGIKICERWQNSFESFYEDMAATYSPGLTLERINPNEDYSKSNCTWITIQEQQKNKTNSRKLTFNGHTKLLIDWAREYNISFNAIHARLKRGWSIEKAITIPPVKRPMTFDKGLFKCELCGIEVKRRSVNQRFCSLEHKNTFYNKKRTKKGL